MELTVQVFPFRSHELLGGGLAHGLGQALAGQGVLGRQHPVVERLSRRHPDSNELELVLDEEVVVEDEDDEVVVEVVVEVRREKELGGAVTNFLEKRAAAVCRVEVTLVRDTLHEEDHEREVLNKISTHFSDLERFSSSSLVPFLSCWPGFLSLLRGDFKKTRGRRRGGLAWFQPLSSSLLFMHSTGS